MTKPQQIKTIFFDLGNVLIDFDQNLMWNNLAKVCGVTVERIKKSVYDNDLWKLYEVGHIKIQPFIASIENDLNKTIDKDKFIQAASNIFSPNLAMIDMVKKLKNRGLELFILSNTCDIHIDHIRRHFPVFDHFHHLILSYEVHLAKPDEKIFDLALTLTKSIPNQCLFIDDIEKHTKQAKAKGICSHCFTNLNNLLPDLEKFGITT